MVQQQTKAGPYSVQRRQADNGEHGRKDELKRPVGRGFHALPRLEYFMDVSIGHATLIARFTANRHGMAMFFTGARG